MNAIHDGSPLLGFRFIFCEKRPKIGTPAVLCLADLDQIFAIK